jgi:uncharacterized protein
MRINVTVIPNSKAIEITRVSEGEYKVRVKEPATEGRANKELIEVLADYFKVPRYTVVVVKGFKSRRKIIEIDM